ncbi:hypothetical protein PsorP6_006333 [Peronosclerospora sorghi]|uniref:Uncharacterized protein n=1 Tax=Peronosclerospora sorghi TaxID=230839 RepID=A0ACC0W144_9STRA|nr:hypothetical protein PsorP6_006333 [Peronosclerospora sorghi]
MGGDLLRAQVLRDTKKDDDTSVTAETAQGGGHGLTWYLGAMNGTPRRFCVRTDGNAVAVAMGSV